MSKRPIYKIISRLVDVRQKEFDSSLLLFFYFFLVSSVTYIIKPVKISLYLEWLSFANLPWAYLLTALLIGFFVSLNSRLLQRVNRRVYISLSLIFFVLTLLVFWRLFKIDRSWVSLAFWFWADIFIITSITQFWILVNDTFTSRQVKRLVGFLVSGGLLGGIAGSFLASVLAKSIKSEDLILICPVALTVCVVLVKFLPVQKPSGEKTGEGIPQESARQRSSYIQSFRMFIKNRHLVLLSGIMATAIIVTTLVDFQFNSTIEMSFSDQNARTAFLGTFFAVLLIFSYFLHVSTMNRILKRFGIKTALVITPLILFLGSLAVFIIPPAAFIYWAISLKGAEKSLSHSLNQSVRELLYIPVPPEIKYKAKVFIDMFVNRFAKGLAALLLLLFFSVLNFSVPQISVVVIVFILVWLGLNGMITKEYVGIVKRNLQIKWQEADKYISDKIDVDLTKLVFDTLHSKEKSSVLYAMNLFDLVKREKLNPEMKKILATQSGLVLASSMDSLLELDGEILLPEMDDTIEKEHFNEQVKEILSLDVYKELMREKIGKIVRSESEEAEVAKMEAAKMIGMMAPDRQLLSHLSRLLKEDSPEVLRYAVESAGKLKKRELVPVIIGQLKNSTTRGAASQALVDYGTKILGVLKDYMGDGEEDAQVRKVIPDIMFKIGTQRAADIMAMELKKRSAAVESELTEAMFKLRTKDPKIRFQSRYIEPEIRSLIKKGYLILIEMYDLMPDEKKAELVSVLENNLARSLKNLFELLSLIYPVEDISKAYQNINTGTKKAIDDSIELLDNILKREFRELIFPLIDDISFDFKVKRCRKLLKHLEKTG